MQKINPNSIIFLIRSYNEATRIIDVIRAILQAGFTEILVVDDGSRDNTQELLHNHLENRIHIVEHCMNRGGGAALETGFEYIRRNALEYGWEYLVTFDADGQHKIADISQFIDTFIQFPDTDIVLGSRFIQKTETNVPLTRRFILWGGRIFTSIISGIHLTDAHNGYRMFRLRVIQNIQLTLDGMEYASELLDKIESGKFRYREVPVNIHYDEYTLSKWQRFGWVFRIVFRFLYSKFFH